MALQFLTDEWEREVDSKAAAIGSGGGVHVVCTALASHPTFSSEFSEASSELLYFLAQTGCLEHLYSAMKTHRSSVDVQLAACTVLAEISVDIVETVVGNVLTDALTCLHTAIECTTRHRLLYMPHARHFACLACTTCLLQWHHIQHCESYNLPRVES